MTALTTSRRIWSAALLACLLSFPWPGQAGDEKKEQDDVDHIALAALLIRDGHYDRAGIVLTKVDLDREDIDLARYYTLKGLVELRKGAMEPAKQALIQAVAEGQTDPMVHVYLAQAYFGLQEYREVVDALEHAGDVAKEIPSVFSMHARAWWHLGEEAQAWRVLNDGIARFPENTAFIRQKVFYLIELGLYQKATELGLSYLERFESPEKDYVAIGSTLRKSHQSKQAREILEKAYLRFPASEAVSVELAHVYLDLNMPSTAASIFEKAAQRNPKLLPEAAELYRRSGDLYHALRLNTEISDQKKKLKQRLAMLLEFEAYELALGTEGALQRVGLLDDQDIRYALAYALYKAGKFERAESHLQKLQRPDLFRKAAELRRAMEECDGKRWMCY